MESALIPEVIVSTNYSQLIPHHLRFSVLVAFINRETTSLARMETVNGTFYQTTLTSTAFFLYSNKNNWA